MTDFGALYERYAPHVRQFVLFLGGEPSLADDITSETFVRAWTAPGPMREETVKAYLFTIARNLYRDNQRRAHRFVPLDETVADDRATDHIEDRSQLSFVLAQMKLLGEVDRVALLMRAQDQMSYEEIAGALGITVTAAKVRVHRARQKLMRATAIGGDARSEKKP